MLFQKHDKSIHPPEIWRTLSYKQLRLRGTFWSTVTVIASVTYTRSPNNASPTNFATCWQVDQTWKCTSRIAEFFLLKRGTQNCLSGVCSHHVLYPYFPDDRHKHYYFRQRPHTKALIPKRAYLGDRDCIG